MITTVTEEHILLPASNNHDEAEKEEAEEVEEEEEEEEESEDGMIGAESVANDGGLPVRLSSIRHTLCVCTAASEAANLPFRHLPQESDTSSDESAGLLFAEESNEEENTPADDTDDEMLNAID